MEIQLSKVDYRAPIRRVLVVLLKGFQRPDRFMKAAPFFSIPYTPYQTPRDGRTYIL